MARTGPKRKSPLNLFLDKVRRNPVNGCWEWQGSRFPNGYGCFNTNRKTWSAHRWAYAQFNGVLPPVVRHMCDNPRCVKPSHLLPGTHQDNVDDRVRRGRVRTSVYRDLILQLRSRGATRATIQRELGISASTVQRWLSGSPSSRTVTLNLKVTQDERDAVKKLLRQLRRRATLEPPAASEPLNHCLIVSPSVP